MTWGLRSWLFWLGGTGFQPVRSNPEGRLEARPTQASA